MTTLITGGSGRTSRSLAKLLHDANHPLIVASRSGEADPYRAVKFDYFQEDTFENPFKADANIDRIYIVCPPGSDKTKPHITKFIDFAISKGVKRVVLLSATQVGPEDNVPSGALHKHLLDTGVDYVVLRPSWFIQNFGLGFARSIREYNQIFSSAGDGRLPFVSTEDIAQAAFEALTAEKSPNKDIFVLGPELLTYDEAANIVSSIIGREITHKRYTADELVNFFSSFGVDPAYAKFLTSMEGRVAKGDEEAIFNSPDITKFIGNHTLAEFIQANKAIYTK